MGLLYCPRCKAKTEATSIEEGKERLDHSIGLYIGKPCQDGKVELSFTNGDSKPEIIPTTISTTDKIIKKKKKSKSDY